MHYLIQHNLFRDNHQERLLETLVKYNLPFTLVKIFPFINKIVDVNDVPTTPYEVTELPDLLVSDPNNVFVFGGVKMARIAHLNNWKPGSMFNENHDYSVYSQHYKENLLNCDSIVQPISKQIDWDRLEYFIRPTQDSKSFTGKVFNKIEWEEFIENQLHNYRSESFNEATLIQIAIPKLIYKEYRFWVVNGEIVTGSSYPVNFNIDYIDPIEDSAVEFAQRMVDTFQIAKAFVIDVCLTDNGWKIVELNCINHAGFYKSNIGKIIESLENYFCL